MTKEIKLQIIDADAHVIETERTWEYLEPAEEKYRPRLYSSRNEPNSQYWVIDNRLRGFITLPEETIKVWSQRSGRNLETPKKARELDDVGLRLRHMDELGIDVQVLHNTLWIEQVTQWPDAEVALCRSWNRWLADVWEQGKGRLRWSCVVPTLVLDEAIVQMRTARANGSVAVCLRSLEGNRVLTDPYFYPIYEEASRLDMAIVVHIANGNPANCELWRTAPGDQGAFASGFQMFVGPTVIFCHVLMVSELPQMFPDLRWAFIEASAKWVPWVCQEAAKHCKVAGRAFPQDVFNEYNIFVTCQTDDDLPYVLKYAGQHSLIIGTDYGHNDPSSDVDAILVFRQRQDISEDTKDRILSHNPKALYSL